jgi:hypothetical protein
VVGLRQIDGMPHESSMRDRAWAIVVPGDVEKRVEKPREVARAFLVLNSAASSDVLLAAVNHGQ